MKKLNISKTELASWGVVGVILSVLTILGNEKEAFVLMGVPDQWFAYGVDIIAVVCVVMRTIKKIAK